MPDINFKVNSAYRGKEWAKTAACTHAHNSEVEDREEAGADRAVEDRRGCIFLNRSTWLGHRMHNDLATRKNSKIVI